MSTASSSSSAASASSLSRLQSPRGRSIINSSGASSIGSTFSVSSSAYRHHHSPFGSPLSASQPQPKLTSDRKHEPKTRGSVGVLVVGLTGPIGCSLVATLVTNRRKLSWHSNDGTLRTADYRGCVTQPQSGADSNTVAPLLSQLRSVEDNVIPSLANASMAAVGGWVSSIFLYFYSFCFVSFQCLALRQRHDCQETCVDGRKIQGPDPSRRSALLNNVYISFKLTSVH